MEPVGVNVQWVEFLILLVPGQVDLTSSSSIGMNSTVIFDFGTFAISSLGNYGAELLNPILPLTAYVTFGPISEAGEVNVRLIFDHRVMDGRHAARALVEMEKNLRGPLVEEMGQSASRESLV